MSIPPDPVENRGLETCEHPGWDGSSLFYCRRCQKSVQLHRFVSPYPAISHAEQRHVERMAPLVERLGDLQNRILELERQLAQPKHQESVWCLEERNNNTEET